VSRGQHKRIFDPRLSSYKKKPLSLNAFTAFDLSH
jgi:hypothetical protein